MSSSLSLSGKSSYNGINLTGKKMSGQIDVPRDIKNIKIQILNNILMPLISKKWKTLRENLICLDSLKKKINSYYGIYKLDDLLIYKEILNSFESVMAEHIQLEKLEKKLYTSNDNTIHTAIYKTTPIRLKPEYEIYDIILGKPNRNNMEKYDIVIISEIEFLLKKNDINFGIIQQFLLNKYPNRIKN
jgi:hypothetical protein